MWDCRRWGISSKVCSNTDVEEQCVLILQRLKVGYWNRDRSLQPCVCGIAGLKHVVFRNIAFHPGEDKDSRRLAKELAKFGDIYVNDAFAFSHRKATSVSAIKDYIPSYAGLLIEQEVDNLSKVLNPKKPLIVVMGGAKIGTKINLIKNLQDREVRSWLHAVC